MIQPKWPSLISVDLLGRGSQKSLLKMTTTNNNKQTIGPSRTTENAQQLDREQDGKHETFFSISYIFFPVQSEGATRRTDLKGRRPES